MAPLLEHKIEAALETVQKPSRYIGGEANQVRKRDATRLVALCYPDAYEVGISNQALQILYGQVNRRDRVAAERVYCPWPDMADALRRDGVPVFMGESEEAFERVLDIVEGEPTRSRRMERLAEIPYLYIPGRGRHEVERAIYTEFGIESQPTRVVVPYSSAIFSRASVEVMRGCTRGCRFCHAGTWYRPVRERPPDEVVEAGLAQLSCTGYDELSLTSLATSDYTGIVPAIEKIKTRLPTLHLSLPSNRVDTGPVALTAAANARQSSITLAPGAAPQRMRDILFNT